MSALTLIESEAPLGYIAPEGLTKEDWQTQIESRLLAVDTAENYLPWIIGDMLLHAEATWSEAFVTSAIDPARFSPSTCTNYSRVAKRFPPFRRRANVVFSVYQTLAGIKDPERRYALVEQASAQGWTVKDARVAMKTNERKESLSFVKVDTARLNPFLDSVNSLLPKMKVSGDRQVIEDFLNFCVDEGIWTGVVL